MVRLLILATLALIGSLTFAPQVQAQGKSGKEKAVRAQAEGSIRFSAAERRIIVEFFTEHRYQPQPLPPGIAKNLARGKPLPPGIAKKQIPAKLQARLPARTGIEVTIFGDRIVLLEASGLVVDVLEGIFD